MQSKSKGKLFIGTSGWSYQHWKNLFYPDDLTDEHWLEFYACTFNTVEINTSFYRLPKGETFTSWKESTPDDFIFAVKASRYITHIKKLLNVESAWRTFIERASLLEAKLGPILFQFPANWKVNITRLNDFLKILPDSSTNYSPDSSDIYNYRYAFEFRNKSWFVDEIFNLLKTKGAALVFADSPIWPSCFEITANFIFIRMHGGKKLYASEYSPDELLVWAEKIVGYLNRRFDVYVYFNNDAYGFAVKNALQLKKLLDKILNSN